MDLVDKQYRQQAHTLEFTASYPVTHPRRETRESSGTHSQALSLPGSFPGFRINEMSSDEPEQLPTLFPLLASPTWLTPRVCDERSPTQPRHLWSTVISLQT